MMPILDIHAHYGVWQFPTQARNVDALDTYLQRFGIEKACFSSVEALTCNFVSGNARLFKDIEGHDRFLGYCTVNPNYVDESIAEMKKYMSKSRCFGLKVHSCYSQRPVNSAPMREILNASRRYGKPVLAHTWSPTDCAAIAEAAAEFATLKFIMGHMGGNDWRPALEAVEEILNVFLDPCCSYAERDKIREALDAVGPKRVVFGSDLMLLNPAFVAGMVVGSDLPERDKERILYTNAKEAFGL